MTLADRIEQAAEGSRELDAEIALAVGLYPFTGDLGAYQDKAEACGEGVTWAPPHYTTSIDAALSLVPEALEWTITRFSDNGRSDCEIWLDAMRSVTSDCATTPLAICAAVLRSHKEDV